MINIKSLGDSFAQRTNSRSLGRMVTGSHIGNPQLTRQMDSWFADFATQIEINPQSGSLLNRTLGSATAPGDTPDLLTATIGS